MQNVVQDIEAGEITGLQTLFATALNVYSMIALFDNDTLMT